MRWTSRVDVRSPRFAAQRDEHLNAVAQLQAAWALARGGGGEKANARHRARGKLLPRERIELLIDRGSPFLELLALAGGHDGGHPGAAILGGIGRVEGVEVLITASEATVQGGAINEAAVRKSARLAEIALENRLPVVHCIESAGADLPNQADVFIPGGEGFRAITQRSREKIPTVSIVFGSCTAGGAYVPGMSDYVIMVDQNAMMYLAGPPLVKMALGEVVDDETLGGAGMHSRVSGVSDYLARDERDAIGIARRIVGRLGWTKRGPGPTGPGRPPRYDVDELLGIVGMDRKQPFDVREVIARIVDDSDFDMFKPDYGPTLVTAFAEIGGYRVGILGNNGVLHAESANKATQFLQLCNQSDTPLLFLPNITGFMVGREAETSGIIKAGARMINAVSNSGVPAITLNIGGSYGAGNYAMMGRAYRPRFLFAWPTQRVAVMGGEQLAGVLDIVKREAAAKRGQDVNEEELAMLKGFLSAKVDRESEALYATGRQWDDGVIDPRDTRTVLTLALSAMHTAPIEGSLTWGVFRP